MIMIDEYEPFGGFVSCSDRADLHAGRILAMVTHFGYKEGTLCLRLKIFADRLESFGSAIGGVDIDTAIVSDDIAFHPGPRCTLRHVIFFPAGAHAAAPADALANIDNIGPLVLGAPLFPDPGCLMASAYPRRVYHQGSCATRYDLFEKHPP